jgi:RNA polymerase sigma-70 factor (ECF subfamily)
LAISARGLRLPEEVAVPGPEPVDPPIADEELVESSRKGDLEAFEQLFERYGPRMKSVAANLLGSAQDAEDAVQEAFLKMFRAAASFRRGARFSTWLYRILVNTCYDQLRTRRRRPEGAGLVDATRARFQLPAGVSDHPLRLELEDSLTRLPERARTVFLLSAVEGLTHREIGEILGVSEATSRTLLFEARRALQRLLGAGGAGEIRA